MQDLIGSWEDHDGKYGKIFFGLRHLQLERGNKPNAKTTNSIRCTDGPNELNWIILHNLVTQIER